MQAFNVTQQRMLAGVLTVANTFFRSLMGLMGKPGLAEGHGLWIVPCQSIHTFWMRFPIDVIFLDQHRTVVHLVESLRPFRVSKHLSKASSVIELPVNVIRTTCTRLGDEIEITQK
ncbi:MAG: DUF192 domain-containing protein [Acidobacteria bacterium]|nr:DUF192 domain-containing protein [Acidobacteriota bacterium]MCI0626327.1 DUF192 domain-containing protein [Acidobacteriota bacterium]MCI0718512.1 DUF192 domain-containing protein [Acidobacteriota bacterium]